MEGDLWNMKLFEKSCKYFCDSFLRGKDSLWPSHFPAEHLGQFYYPVLHVLEEEERNLIFKEETCSPGGGGGKALLESWRLHTNLLLSSSICMRTEQGCCLRRFKQGTNLVCLLNWNMWKWEGCTINNFPRTAGVIWAPPSTSGSQLGVFWLFSARAHLALSGGMCACHNLSGAVCY